MKKFTIEQKVLATFIASVTAVILLAFATWNLSRQSLEAANYVAHTLKVVANLNEVEVQLFRSESAQRAYLLTGNRSFFDEHSAALKHLHEEIQNLKQLTADNQDQQVRIAELRREIARRIELLGKTIAVRDTKGLEAAAMLLGSGATAMENIFTLTGEIDAVEQKLLKSRQAAQLQHTQAAQWMFGAMLILLGLTVPILYMRIRNEMREREESQTALKRLTSVLDNTPDFVMMADENRKLTYINRAAREQLGIGLDEETGNISAQGVYPSWALKRVRQEGVPAAIATGSWSGENAFQTRSGEEIPISQVVIAHRQPDGTHALSTIARSISERREAEQLLHLAAKYDTSNARILTLYNTVTDRKQVLQGTLDILAENHSFPVSTFHSYEEWGGALKLTAARGAPENTAPLIKLGEGLVGEAAQSLRVIHLVNSGEEGHAEMTIQAGFGAFKPAALLFCPVLFREHLIGVLALAATEPLTERDRGFVDRLSAQLGVALHNIRQLEDMRLLAEQLRSRSEEIALKNEQLEEASRMKSEFLATMSHELRTPLNAIIGFSEVMVDGMVGPVNAEQREYIGDILSSGKHLLSLINDILDLSKVESGHMTLDLDAIDPASLASSGIAIVKEKAAMQKIQLVDRTGPDLAKLVLDARKTKQIIYNLLSNAMKFTPDGGLVELCLRRVPHGEIAALRPTHGVRLFPLQDNRFADFLEISVSDSGIGISDDDLQRLFAPFTQIDSSHSRQYEGTGLGLAMVQRLATLHGGGLMVQSSPAKGSRFTIWLPWRDPDAVLEQAIVDTASAVKETRKSSNDESLAIGPLVLLVEDDPNTATIFQVQLEAEGYRVLHAPTAEAGLELVRAGRPDAIVLDVLLPGMDGWEMLMHIKQSPATADIPVIIASVTDDVSHGFALGAAHVLIKPVTREDLANALASMKFNASKGRRVLVADDDPNAVSLVSVHLKSAGFIPIGAYGGREAIDMAISERPSLIVLDLMMPDVSGFDVVHALRMRPDTADIPILILTAKILTPADRLRLNLNVQRILEKSSFNPKILQSEMKRILARTEKKATQS